ncbi:peptidylprolyl isomerase [Aquabacterium sp. A7-Y]|uniref:peptidylprolyl isomerase n=1 Tax=Aquabacterium sp. A7-Y TaxID=1349605 RepID=UPI00223D098D|nr:peptidylprolyl isomerase [Aquabacterium sp. A7-Y]MCW7536604.1 peptidylprolyl isomerase [Aquabacterium sp. A7-Y]
MTPSFSLLRSLRRRVAAAAAAFLLAPGLALPQSGSAARGGDFIVAVVNQELVTNNDVQQRLARIEQDAARNGARLPPREQLRQQVLDALIDDRAQLSHARNIGLRIDEAEIDRAVGNVAAQNQLSLPQLRERLRNQGIDFARFRNNVRDELMLSRLREREVQARIRVSDADIQKFLNELRGEAAGAAEYNIAQVLVAVPEGATPQQDAERRARAEDVLARAKAGTAFAELVRDYSDGPNKDQGGQLGMRSADRLPDLFVQAVSDLKAGELVSQPVRSGAGYHVLKLIERKDSRGLAITQTRSRHILLRVSPQLTQQTALRRLADYKRQVESGQAGFAQLAREFSEDGSASQGGDLGWANPGQFVPEFEQVLNQLAVGKLSEPFMSRFGAHLVQLTERREAQLDARQQRELATNALREQKFDSAYAEWAREIRNQAYIEMREAPQ